MGTRRLLVKIATQFDSQGTDKAEQSVKGLGASFKNNLGTIASGALVAAGAALAKFANDSVRAFTDFDKGMREVFTLMPGITQDAMGKMQDDVLAFSKATGQDATDSVAALYQALSAGVPPGNVFDFLETANAASLGGVTSLETAVDGITSVVNAYGKEAINAATASDVMFTAVRLGKTNFEQLSTSLYNVVPTAASLGVSFEDVAANLAALTAAGVPTSVATTQLRQAFIEASKSGSALDQALKSLTGQSFAQLIASGKTSSEIFLELRGSMPEQEFRDLFGSVEASNAVLGITSETAQGVIDAFGPVAETMGATAEAAAVMTDSLKFLEDRANTSTDALKVQAGQALEPLKRNWYETVIAVGDYLGKDLELRNQLLDSSAALEDFGYSGVSLQKALGALGEGTTFWRDSMVDADVMARRTKIAVELLESGFQGGADELAELVKEQEVAVARSEEMSEFYSKQAEATNEATEAIAEQTTVLRLNEDLMRSVNRSLLAYGGSLGPTTQELEDMAYASGELGDYEEAMLAPITAANEALEAQKEILAASGQAFMSLSEGDGPLGLYYQSLEDIANGSDVLRVNQDSLNSAMINAAAAGGASAAQLALLKVATGELSAEQAEAVIKQVALEQTLQRLGERYADGTLSMGDYISAAQQAVRDINNMTIEFDTQTGSVNTNNEAIGTLVGTMGEIPSEIRTHISITSDPLPNMPTFGGSGPTGTGDGGVQARAVGGPVNAGQPYLIGERGPELFVPNASGMVVPNGRFGGYTDQSQTIYQVSDEKTAALVAALTDSRKRSRLDQYMSR
jgi:TP901 family phage tail tape measure protein